MRDKILVATLNARYKSPFRFYFSEYVSQSIRLMMMMMMIVILSFWILRLLEQIIDSTNPRPAS